MHILAVLVVDAGDPARAQLRSSPAVQSTPPPQPGAHMKPPKATQDISTQAVHAGERRGVPHGLPVSTPVYSTATFTYDSMEEMDQVFAGETAGYVYTR